MLDAVLAAELRRRGGSARLEFDASPCTSRKPLLEDIETKSVDKFVNKCKQTFNFSCLLSGCFYEKHDALAT
jgi:hypothetical protein